MAVDVARTSLCLVIKAALLIAWLAAASSPTMAQDPRSPSPAEPRCSVDLSLPGMMKDIVSNALIRGVKRPEADVREFLKNAETRYSTGQDLLRAAARHFEVDEALMTTEVERFRHCNCEHDAVAGGREAVVEVSAFARDVTLHVV